MAIGNLNLGGRYINDHCSNCSTFQYFLSVLLFKKRGERQQGTYKQVRKKYDLKIVYKHVSTQSPEELSPLHLKKKKIQRLLSPLSSDQSK